MSRSVYGKTIRHMVRPYVHSMASCLRLPAFAAQLPWSTIICFLNLWSLVDKSISWNARHIWSLFHISWRGPLNLPLGWGRESALQLGSLHCLHKFGMLTQSYYGKRHANFDKKFPLQDPLTIHNVGHRNRQMPTSCKTTKVFNLFHISLVCKQISLLFVEEVSLVCSEIP